MRIAQSSIAFSSAHAEFARVHRRVELEVRRPEPVALPPLPAPPATASPVEATTPLDEDAGATPQLALVRMILERLLGRRFEIVDLNLRPSRDEAGAPTRAEQQPARSAEGRGVTLRVDEERIEAESTSVSAAGIVRTTDGREIAFEMGLTLERFHRERITVEVSTGAPQKKDPLVVNLAGTAAHMGDERIEFDIDSDGTLDSIPFVASGSGFLVLDRDGNGRVDDGSELFGARSGDGFAELAELDADGNGWIDEGDPAFAQLQVWERSGGADRLRGLLEGDVGALHLGAVASAFEYRDGENTPLAALRATGVYLKESGGGGTVQQLDLYT